MSFYAVSHTLLFAQLVERAIFRTSDCLHVLQSERERGKEGKKGGKGSAKTAIYGATISMSEIVGLRVTPVHMD